LKLIPAELRATASSRENWSIWEYSKSISIDWMIYGEARMLTSEYMKLNNAGGGSLIPFVPHTRSHFCVCLSIFRHIFHGTFSLVRCDVDGRAELWNLWKIGKRKNFFSSSPARSARRWKWAKAYSIEFSLSANIGDAAAAKRMLKPSQSCTRQQQTLHNKDAHEQGRKRWKTLFIIGFQIM
jgi:hypothetical protein